MTFSDFGIDRPDNLEKSVVVRWLKTENEISILARDRIEAEEAHSLAQLGVQAWEANMELASVALGKEKPKLVRITTDSQEICITGNISDAGHLFIGVCQINE